jgi:hypothetical protein
MLVQMFASTSLTKTFAQVLPLDKWHLSICKTVQANLCGCYAAKPPWVTDSPQRLQT